MRQIKKIEIFNNPSSLVQVKQIRKGKSLL